MFYDGEQFRVTYQEVAPTTLPRCRWCNEPLMYVTLKVGDKRERVKVETATQREHVCPEIVGHVPWAAFKAKGVGGPVTRLADMSPEKQAEMRRLYGGA